MFTGRMKTRVSGLGCPRAQRPCQLISHFHPFLFQFSPSEAWRKSRHTRCPPWRRSKWAGLGLVLSSPHKMTWSSWSESSSACAVNWSNSGFSPSHASRILISKWGFCNSTRADTVVLRYLVLFVVHNPSKAELDLIKPDNWYKLFSFSISNRHNNGHVTKIQASQCLHTLGLTDDSEEIRVTETTSCYCYHRTLNSFNTRLQTQGSTS